MMLVYGKRHERPGRPAGVHPDAGEVGRLYMEKGLSIRDTAARLGVTKDMVYRVIHEVHIPSRPRVRFKLANADPAHVFALLAEYGVIKTAARLGVSRSTIQRWIRAKVSRVV